MRNNCFLCVRRKKCSDELKLEFSLMNPCPGRLIRIKADK